MARFNIGEGLWATIRGSLNLMFIEIYAYMQSTASKYTDTINLSAGIETDVVTTLTTEPYIVNLYDSSGVKIDLPISVILSGGVYHLLIYSTDALTDVKLFIIY